MLFDLKEKKRKKTFLDSFVSGFAPAPIPFDPFSLPGFRSGWLMNQISDTPQGSINPLANNNILSFPLLANTPYRLTNGFGAKPLKTLNGFNVYDFALANNWLDNFTVDVLTGITDFSLLFGFQFYGAPIAANQCLFHFTSNIGSPYVVGLVLPSGALHIQLTDGTNSITLISGSLTYNDLNPHCIVATFNQTTKTVNVITDLETMTGSNAAFVPGVLTPGIDRDFRVGLTRSLFYPLTECLLGDFIIYNGILSAPDEANLFTYEKTRLGI